MEIHCITPRYVFINNLKELNFYDFNNCLMQTEIGCWVDLKEAKIINVSTQNLNEEQVNIYIAKPLDSYETIANKLNVDVEILKKKNNNENVFIGKKIYY